MFSFDHGTLFVLASKDLVVTLRNMAELEKGTEHAKLLTVDVKNGSGVHQGVGFFSLGHPTVLYFEEKPAEPVAEEKVEYVKAEAATAEQPTS